MSRMFSATRPRSTLRSKSARRRAPAMHHGAQANRTRPPQHASNCPTSACSFHRARHRLNVGDAVDHPGRVVGRGQRAGSPSADHISRPNGSVKPAIGFQAAAGCAAMPSASQPFHGKSFSFTVRRKIGELRPLQRVVADVLDAGRELGIEVFALHRVADDRLAGSRRSAARRRSRSRLMRSTASAIVAGVQPARGCGHRPRSFASDRSRRRAADTA